MPGQPTEADVGTVNDQNSDVMPSSIEWQPYDTRRHELDLPQTLYITWHSSL